MYSNILLFLLPAVTDWALIQTIARPYLCWEDIAYVAYYLSITLYMKRFAQFGTIRTI